MERLVAWSCRRGDAQLLASVAAALVCGTAAGGDTAVANDELLFRLALLAELLLRPPPLPPLPASAVVAASQPLL